MTTPEQLLEILPIVKRAARAAGDAIMAVYDSGDFAIETKADESPLTRADRYAHQIIVDTLRHHFADIPCLSEESDAADYQQRLSWPRCFIIDPLDGTKEFIARNGEFTVNIALVEKGKVLLGVIYAPVMQTLYFAADRLGAFKQTELQAAERISVRRVPIKNNQPRLTVAASRRHGQDKVAVLCQNLPAYELISRGSSLKMCLIAEGKADFCPRLAPTCEWDTAAAQSIVEQAGGQLLQLDFSPMTYNQRDSLINPHFLVLGDPDFSWQKMLVLPSVDGIRNDSP